MLALLLFIVVSKVKVIFGRMPVKLVGMIHEQTSDLPNHFQISHIGCLHIKQKLLILGLGVKGQLLIPI